MKRVYLFLVLLFCASRMLAQNTETDSLKRLLAKSGETPGRVILLENLSYAYVSTYPDTALRYAMEGLDLARKLNDRYGESICINALGNVYFSVGDYPRSLEMYLKTLEMKEEMKAPQGLAVTYFNIANVYTEQEDYRHALEYLFKAKKFDTKTKDEGGILFDLYSLGSIYLRMKKTDSALYYIRDAYRMARKMNDENMIGAIINTFGEVHFALNQLSEAASYYRQSIPYVEKIKDNEVLSASYYGLAKVAKNRGALDSAIYYGRRAFAIAREGSFQKQVLETSTFLSGVFKAKSQFDSAFHYQELSMATKDSIFNVEKIKKVQNMKLLEQQRQQAMETEQLEYRNKVRLYIVIFVSIVFLAIAVILWRNNKQKQRAYTALQDQKAKTDEALEELKSTQEQLVQKEKMASLGELTAGIAHEIQNPLNFVNNFSEVSVELMNELKKEAAEGNTGEVTELAEDVISNLEKVAHHGKRADSIVKGMLAHSGISSEQKELTDINELANEYLKLSYESMRAKERGFRAAVKTEFDPALTTVQVARQDLGRALLNLYNNAFYAVNEKKKHLDGTYQPAVTVSTRQLDRQLEIRVKDNGTGMPEHVVKKVFQPFFTTKPTGKGTGLGLSLSYDIITRGHGGDLRVETQDGEFAEFIIDLPVQ